MKTICIGAIDVVRKLELEIPDAEYARLVRDAAQCGQSPESAILKIVSDRYGISSDKIAGLSLMKYAGCISSDDPNGSNNEKIDEDLAKEYGRGLDER